MASGKLKMNLILILLSFVTVRQMVYLLGELFVAVLVKQNIPRKSDRSLGFDAMSSL